MRRGPVDSGWAGSLFDEPIAQVKPTLTALQFPETGPFPEEKGELVHYAHETWVRFLLNGHLVEEFVSTDRPIASASAAMGAEMKEVDDARVAAGNLPRARCSVENGIRTYEDPAIQEVRASSASVAELTKEPRPIRMPEYSFATGAKFGEKPEHTEAEAQGDDLCPGCLCHTCDWSQHICKSCEDPAACATRGKHTIACPECSGLKKPSRKALAKAKKQAPTVEHPTLIRYGHETWGQYELEGRLVEEFVSTDKPVRKESEFAADMVAVDAARKAAGDLPLARSFIEKGARGIRVYEDPALQEGGTLCCHLVVSKQNGGLCTGCSDQRGTPCSYSRPAEHTSPEPVIKPWKPEGAVKKWQELHCGKHHACRDDCAGLRSGALCPFVISLSFLKDIVREGSLPADLLEDRAKDDAEAKAAKKLAKVTKPELAPAVKPAKEQKPAKAKKQPIVPKRGDNYCVLRGGDCAVHNGCQNGDVPCTLKDVPHLEEIHLPCEIHALLDLAVEPMKPTVDVVFHQGDRVRVRGQLLGYVHAVWDKLIEVALGDDPKLAKAKSYVDGVTYTAARPDEVEKIADAKPSRVKKPKSEAAPVLQDCSDCLCPSCANNGASCTDCKGPEKCAKHNNKMGLCPDFRWKDGKEQDCMHGCLCIGCALVGQKCKECVGPIRCSKPTMKCKEYVGGDMEDIGDDTEDPYTPEHPYPGDGKVPDLIDVLEGKT